MQSDLKHRAKRVLPLTEGTVIPLQYRMDPYETGKRASPLPQINWLWAIPLMHSGLIWDSKYPDDSPSLDWVR